MFSKQFNTFTCKVPVGVSIHVDEKGSRKLLGNLDNLGEKLIVAHGGMGGGPSNGWLGQAGQAMHIRLDLRVGTNVPNLRVC